MIPPNDYFNNRVYLGQVSQMLANNMVLSGSASIPFINSNYRVPMPMGAPTMFGQMQGALSGMLGPEIGGIVGLLGNPAIQSMLPTGVGDFVNTMMTSPALGGTADPAAFMMSQVYRNVGRGIPRITMPYDFTNMQATDAYLSQRQAFSDYMGTLNGNPLGATNISALRMGANNENINRVIALRNAIMMRQEDAGFKNAFGLTNAIGDTVDVDSFYSKSGLAGINSEQDALRFLSDANNKKTADKILADARLASGLITGADYLSGFVGGSRTDNAQMQSIGDFLIDTLNIGNNRQTFMPEVSRIVGNMGGMATAMAVGSNNQSIAAANLVAGRIESALGGPNNMFSSIQGMGYRRTQELMSTLSNNGLISAGGVDVFGSLKQGDVDKLSNSLMTQLEGFSEIAKVGKRVGLKVDEVVKGMDTIYGGRINQVLSNKADSILSDFNRVTGPNGQTAGDLLVAQENIRRAGIPGATPLSGAGEISEFLRLEAQRQAGREVGKDLAETINLGRFAGIDAKGTMAVANTVTQMLQNIGMGGEGSLDMTQQALAIVASSRTSGAPVTVAQAVAGVTGIMATAADDPSTKAYASLMRAAELGINGLNKNDPRVQAITEKFRRGEAVDDSEVMALVGNDRVYSRLLEESPRNMASIFNDIQSNQVSGANGVVSFFRRELADAVGGDADADRIFSRLEKDFAPGGGGIAEALKRIRTMAPNQARAALQKAGFSSNDIDALNLVMRQKNYKFAGMEEGAASDSVIDFYLDAEELTKKLGLDGITSAAQIMASAEADLSQIMADAAKTNTGSKGKDLEESFKKIREEKVKRIKAEILAAPGNKYSEAEAEALAREQSNLSFTDILEGLGELGPDAAMAILDESEKKVRQNLASSDPRARAEAELNIRAIDAARREQKSKIEAKEKEAARQAKEGATAATAPATSANQAPTTGSGTVQDPGTQNAGSQGTPSSGGGGKTKKDLEALFAEVLQELIEIKNKLVDRIKVIID